MNIKKYIKKVWQDIVNDESGQWGALPAWSYPQQPKKTPSWRSPIYSPGGYIPKQQKPSPKQVRQPATQPVTQPTGGGGYQPFQYPAYQGGGFDWASYMAQLQQPAMPQVTAQMIADWLSRATGEAGLIYDPQKLGIQQALASSLLGGEQAIVGLSPAYTEMIENIGRWKEEELGSEAKRWYARGLGRGGGLIEEERKIGETALKETTKAETEKARKIAEIEEKGRLLTEQAGEKQVGIEAGRGQYITARKAEFREKYENTKAELSQQQFQNKMQIAQFGMTAEAQEYDRWLGQAQMANEQWYREQSIRLETESMRRGAQATAGMTEYQTAQMGLSERKFEEDTRRWGLEYALAQQEKAAEGDLTAGGLRDLYGQAFTGRYSGWTPTSQRQYLGGMGVPDETVNAWIKKLYDLSGVTSTTAGVMGGG